MSTPPAPAADPVEFKRELTAVVPHLRAFARGLCGRPDMADDLVQETLMKAWAAQERFEPGTSMRAWTFVILRNAYLTDMRRNRFRGEYDENVAERILTAPAGQEEPIHLSDMHRALLTLPPERRDQAVRALSSPFLDMRLVGQFETSAPPDAEPLPAFRPVMAAYRAAMPDREIAVYRQRTGPIRSLLSNPRGRILLADEISPDSCRLWDMETNEKMDKDRFRRDLGNVTEAYADVARRLGIMKEHGQGSGEGQK